AALAELGRAEEALAECSRVAELSREPVVEAGAEVVKAHVAIDGADYSTAEAHANRAEKLAPGSLATAYWRGRALFAEGRLEGRHALASLAKNYSGEYWGRLAAQLVNAEAPESPEFHFPGAAATA
ncbi:MAG TPA: hypothetical protein VGS41_14885, partial [Chthonomonadales bacterium]|nr:hypothetical protein [Chthonomonadales bacterium]